MLVDILRIAEESDLVVVKTVLRLLLTGWSSLSDILILKIHVRCEGNRGEDEVSKVETGSTITLMLAIGVLLPGCTVIGSGDWSSLVHLLEEHWVTPLENNLSEAFAEHFGREFCSRTLNLIKFMNKSPYKVR